MTEGILEAIGVILFLGVLAQWLAWRFRVPAILLLLLTGIMVGPGIEMIDRLRLALRPFAPFTPLPRLDPQAMFGDLLIPVVSAAVAVILFEGGLSLRVRELSSAGSVLWRLVSVGALVTLAIVAAGARLIGALDTGPAILLGSILVVTGPTVIGPLLRNVRPAGPVGSILRWEGILIDPIGAVLSVVVFEAVLIGQGRGGAGAILGGIVATMGFGSAVGFLGATIMIVVMKRYLIPDFLHNAVSLALVVGSFTAANVFVHESGLVAVTVMGILLANQRMVQVHHIIEFKETLRVLLISGLFIVLGARLDLGPIIDLGWRGPAFLVFVFLARPVSVFVSSIGSKLSRSERLFLSVVAPRGIVAAAIASVFALRFQEALEHGAITLNDSVPSGDALVPLAFIAIIGTIVFSGLAAPRVARARNLSDPDPNGVLIVGANVIGLPIGKALSDAGVRVMLVDTDGDNVLEAVALGLHAHRRSVLSMDTHDELTDLSAFGTMIAVTSNGELNALAGQHFVHAFGRAQVFQLPHRPAEEHTMRALAPHQEARQLFDPAASFNNLANVLQRGGRVISHTLQTPPSVVAVGDEYEGRMLPLFLVRGNTAIPFATDGSIAPHEGDVLIALVWTAGVTFVREDPPEQVVPH